MQNHYTTVARRTIAIRSEKAESLSNALHGITKLLEKNAIYRESAGVEPFMDGFIEGCLHEALLTISSSMLELSSHIDMLSNLDQEDAS